jgi:hypothetical protein
MAQNEELIKTLEEEKGKLKKNYRLAKVRVYDDAIEFLKMVDVATALEMMEDRQGEDTGRMSYHSAAYGEAYEEVTRLLTDHLYKEKKKK